MQCTKCGADNKAGARFCRQCGSAFDVAERAAPADATMARVCQVCGAGNTPTARFCKGCGSALATPAIAPENLAAVVPPPGAKLEAAVQKHTAGASLADETEPIVDKPDSPGVPPSNGKLPVLLAGAVVVLVGLGLGWYFWSGRQPASAPPDNTAAQEVTQPTPAASASSPAPAAAAVAEPAKQTHLSPPLPAAPVAVGQAEPPRQKPILAHPKKPESSATRSMAASKPAAKENSPVQNASSPRLPASSSKSETQSTQSPLERALQECDKSANFFERKFCKEKTRLAMCEGKWGQVPECPDRSW